MRLAKLCGDVWSLILLSFTLWAEWPSYFQIPLHLLLSQKFWVFPPCLLRGSRNWKNCELQKPYAYKDYKSWSHLPVSWKNFFWYPSLPQMGSCHRSSLGSLSFPSESLSLIMRACVVVRCLCDFCLSPCWTVSSLRAVTVTVTLTYTFPVLSTHLLKKWIINLKLIMSWHHLIFRILFVCRYLKLLFVFFRRHKWWHFCVWWSLFWLLLSHLLRPIVLKIAMAAERM